MVKKGGKKSDPFLLKGFLKGFIVRTFSLDCLRLQQTKKYTRLYFYKENVSEIIDLTREAFQYFFQSRIKPKHITSVAINIF